MALPFDEDPVHKAEIRARSLRKRKARALMASGHEAYRETGKQLMDEVEAEVVEARKERERRFDEALKQAGLEREAERYAESMAFAREKERNDIEYQQRQLEQRAREIMMGDRYRRDALAQNEQLRRDAMAQQEELRRATLAQQRELAGLGPEVEPGTETLPSHAVAPPPGPTVGGEPLPSTQLPGKAPVFQQKAVMESAAAIVRLNRAYKLLQKTPSAYDFGNQALSTVGAVAGAIPVLGQVTGPLATSGVQRLMTREERETRNEVDSLVDEAIKAISGGQVTQYEDLRKTYLPRPYDNTDQAEEKIRGMLAKAIGTYKSFGGMDDVPLPEMAGEVDIDAIVRKYLPKDGGR